MGGEPVGLWRRAVGSAVAALERGQRRERLERARWERARGRVSASGHAGMRKTRDRKKIISIQPYLFLLSDVL